MAKKKRRSQKSNFSLTKIGGPDNVIVKTEHDLREEGGVCALPYGIRRKMKRFL